MDLDLKVPRIWIRTWMQFSGCKYVQIGHRLGSFQMKGVFGNALKDCITYGLSAVNFWNKRNDWECTKRLCHEDVCSAIWPISDEVDLEGRTQLDPGLNCQRSRIGAGDAEERVGSGDDVADVLMDMER